MSDSAARKRTRRLLLVVAFSLPFALVSELGAFWALERAGLGALVSPPEVQELSVLIAPELAQTMWILAGAIPVMAGLGVVLHRWKVRRAISKRPPAERTAKNLDKANFDALMMSTSMPQIPGVVALFAHLIGAETLSVAAVLGVSTLGVFGVAALTSKPPQMPVA